MFNVSVHHDFSYLSNMERIQMYVDNVFYTKITSKRVLDQTASSNMT